MHASNLILDSFIHSSHTAYISILKTMINEQLIFQGTQRFQEFADIMFVRLCVGGWENGWIG